MIDTLLGILAPLLRGHEAAFDARAVSKTRTMAENGKSCAAAIMARALHEHPEGDSFRTQGAAAMIRKLATGKYRLYSRKKNDAGKRRNLGTFNTRAAAEKHERAVQFFKHH